MAMNKAAYIEKMRGMFASDGWKECFHPQLVEIRKTQEYMLRHEAMDMAQIYGARFALDVIDQIVDIQDLVAQLALEVEQDPQAGGEHVVESDAVEV